MNLEQLIYEYPQLSLPVEPGMHTDERYTRIVRKGILPEVLPNLFCGSPEDTVTAVDTPVGTVEVIHLANRADFIRFVQVMVHKCEPVPIPDSMGAVTIAGISNWRKIQTHKRQWCAEHPFGNWSGEFKQFTATPHNFKDTLLLTTAGPYSAVPGARAGFPEEEWLAHSRTIRTYHELTHLVSRTLWPENKHPVRDEITADCIGLLAAFGNYDPALAGILLGLTEDGCTPGGRLRNYVNEIDDTLLSAVRSQIALTARLWQENPTEPFAFLRLLEEIKTGLENWK